MEPTVEAVCRVVEYEIRQRQVAGTLDQYSLQFYVDDGWVGAVRTMTIRLIEELAAFRGPDFDVLYTYATWWDHAKHAMSTGNRFWRWVARRFKVPKVETHTFHAEAMLPAVPIPPPHQRGMFKVIVHERGEP